MLELMRQEEHYPKNMCTKKWTRMYVLVYGAKLETKDPVYKRVKMTFENDKASWRRKRSSWFLKLSDDVDTLRLDPYYADATKETLFRMILAQRKAFREMAAARDVA